MNITGQTDYLTGDTQTVRASSGVDAAKNAGNRSLISTKTTNLSSSSEYIRTYTSYSGHDMVCTFELPLQGGGSIAKVAGTVQTISYSVHNEKMPVRVLGDMNIKGYVFGNRTIAGSIVFTVFDKHWAADMMDEYLDAVKSNAHMLTDEMPPLNVTISMANEYGDRSRLAIYGVSFVNEGQVMSIQDIYTENTYQFFAKDVDYLTTATNSNSGSGTGTITNRPVIGSKVGPDGKIIELDDSDLDNSSIYDKTPYEDSILNPANQSGSHVNIDPYDMSSEAKDATDRDSFISGIDNTYRNIADAIQAEYEAGSITVGQKADAHNEAQRVWKQRRTQADVYYTAKENDERRSHN